MFRVNKTSDYTIMSNRHLKERDMSLKAKGLLSLMLSLPDDWDYSIVGLVTLSKDGKDIVMKTLNELEDFGYLTRTQDTDDKGRFAGYIYNIFESPQTEKPCPENPNTDKPNAEKPYTENPTLLNTNILNTNNKELTDSNIDKTSKKRFGEFKRVLLSIAEYDRLVEEFGQAVVDNQIRLVDEYVESNNNKNKYTNFNLVIRKSIRENWFNKKPTSSTPTKPRCTDYDDLI